MKHLVDLDTYPIDQPGSARLRAIIDRSRNDLGAQGCSVLPHFFAPGLAQMQREAAHLAPQAYFKERYGNPYSSADDPTLPADHPIRARLKRDQGFVAGDLIAETTGLKHVYHAADFRNFIGACLGFESIHEYGDPLGCLVVNVVRNRAEHPWHFDTNEFTVSTVVQAPEAGGTFEYCPNIRAAGRENFDRVRRVIRDEDRSEVRALDLRPGDMQLFRGRYSLHRVTPVQGSTPRLSVIFSYAQQPGMVATAERSRHLFGRTSVHREQRAPATGHADALTD